MLPHDHFLDECIAVLERTPATLDTLLRGLPGVWTSATDGPNNWSPHTVIGHLIHGELTDWMPRLDIILTHGPARPFDPFDREGGPPDGTLPELLDQFATLRRVNLARLRALELTSAQLDLEGTHPAFGRVTLRQLLATWTAHDLSHIVQISRTMARRLEHDVGPWAAYLSVMKREH